MPLLSQYFPHNIFAAIRRGSSQDIRDAGLLDAARRVQEAEKRAEEAEQMAERERGRAIEAQRRFDEMLAADRAAAEAETESTPVQPQAERRDGDGEEGSPLGPVVDSSGPSPALTIDPRGYVQAFQESKEDDLLDISAPKQLHSAFDPRQVQPWVEGRFQHVQKLSDAKRNRGVVHLMRDKKTKRDLAVKQMPNWWIRSSHSGFVAEHPGETELPWQDIGCTYFLNSVGYLPACDLHGVYRDATHTYVMQSLATEGDLFNWCQEADQQPGPDREHVVADLAVQILAGVKMLHDMSITHRDLSLENILLTKPRQSANGCSNSRYEIRIIDFSMASSTRTFQKSVRGKASYQAPELHTDEKYDAFLADCFAVGVTLYCMLMMDYPWLSTKPGGCKCFEYVETHGFRAYIAKRKIRGGSDRVADRMSEPVKSLIEGMLCFDPSKRLTLGEKQWPDNSPRRSVWDEEWVKDFLLTEEFPQVMAGTVVV